MKVLFVYALMFANVWSVAGGLYLGQKVAGASYVIYEGLSDGGGVPTSSRLATFYTFDGQSLGAVEHTFSFPAVDKMLDPDAPKPRPVRCKVEYWPAIPIGFGMTKGVPGDMIYFYDRHEHCIGRRRYDRSRRAIVVSYDRSGPSGWYVFHETSDLAEVAPFEFDVTVAQSAFEVVPKVEVVRALRQRGCVVS